VKIHTVACSVGFKDCLQRACQVAGKEQGSGDRGNLMLVQGLKELGTLCYAWRAEGDLAWEDGDRFYPGFFASLDFASA
jgi:hypothetical protein